MPSVNSQREPQRNGAHSNGRALTAEEPAGLDGWGDDALRQEMERLTAANRELLASAGVSTEAPQDGDAGELERLRAENAELRRRLDEAETAYLERAESDQEWSERQKEYEALLEEKSEVIRELHQRLHEARDSAVDAKAAHAGGAGRPMDPALHEDLLLLKQQLEEERTQLEQDEEALMQQMRQMELAMSRERAEMARQRSELQRLHNELRHEMELASRDSGLRERLAPLQRRQQEVAGRKPGTDDTTAGSPSSAEASPARKNSSGLFRRLFGSKDS